VLAGLAGGLGILAVPGALPVLHVLANGVTATSELTHAAFTGTVGTRFRVHVAQGRTATLRLLAVRALVVAAANRAGPATSGEGFAPIFSGRLSETFGQGTYAVTHPTLGRFPMFLVPVGPAGADQRYEAVFNRLWK
jgi:hypothetical protein